MSINGQNQGRCDSSSLAEVVVRTDVDRPERNASRGQQMEKLNDN
jgi:hypothetical protein